VTWQADEHSLETYSSLSSTLHSTPTASKRLAHQHTGLIQSIQIFNHRPAATSIKVERPPVVMLILCVEENVLAFSTEPERFITHPDREKEERLFNRGP
jgi:hypothetical protein